MRVGPKSGEWVHVGPRCHPAVVFQQGDNTEIYVRELVPVTSTFDDLAWGKVMEVQTHDREGWISFGNGPTDWHWPERGHE